MATVVTKVVYAVKDAIKNLKKLDKKVQESEKEASTGFGEAGESSEAFNSILGKLPGPISKIASGLGKVTSAAGAMAAGIGAAGIAIAAVAVQFVDLPKLLRDSAEGMNAFATAADRLLQARELASEISDSAIRADLKRQKEAFRNQDAVLDIERAALQTKKNLLTDEVSAAKKASRERTKAVRDSVKTREQLERQLSSRLAARKSGQFAGQPADIQSANLLDVARQEAAKGNIDTAEDLVDEAKSLSSELKNQSFALSDMEATNQAIDSALKRQIQSAKKSEASAKRRLATQQAITDSVTSEVKLLTDRDRQITAEKTLLTGQRKQVKEATTTFNESTQLDTAARAVQSAATVLNRELVDGSRSLKENIIDSISQLKSNLKKGGVADAAQGQLEVGLKALVELQRILASGTADVSELGAAIADLAPKVQIARGALETVKARGEIEGIDVDLSFFDRFTTQVNNLGQAIILANKGGAAGDTRVGIEGLGEQFDQFNRRIGASVAEVTPKVQGLGEQAAAAATSLERVANLASPATAAPGAVTAVAAPSALAAPSAPQQIELTLNVTVEGGIISREVMEQVTDIINREVRKLTSGGVQ